MRSRRKRKYRRNDGWGDIEPDYSRDDVSRGLESDDFEEDNHTAVVWMPGFGVVMGVAFMAFVTGQKKE